MATFLIHLCVLMGGGVCIWIVGELIVTQANQNLLGPDKIQRSIWSRTGLKRGEMSRAWETHQQFFPNSSLRSLYVALCVLVVLWLFFGLTLLQKLASATTPN
jgi:hypothetical protein